MKNNLISIIIPVYNEEKNIFPFYKEIIKNLKPLKKYKYELIFVDDGSNDKSFEVIKKISSVDKNVKYIEFSRNFGKEIALTAGINNCQGQAAITIDADRQHPAKILGDFIKKWEKGADIVIGIRKNSSGDGIFKKIGSWLFYKIINLISEVKIKPGSTDYRLIDRKVIDQFNKFGEINRITRGLIDWLGFKKEYIYFFADKRFSGASRYNNLKLIKLALSSFVSMSLFPLKLAGYLGIIIIFSSGILGIFVIIEKFVLHDSWKLNITPTAMLAIVILFLVGVILSCLGLIALYIANIHTEILKRPIYIIKNKKL